MQKYVLAAGLAALAGCSSPEPAGLDRIDTSYVHGGGNWSSGGGITAVAKLVERDGAAAVCGAWMTDPQSVLSIHYNEDVMAAASVFAGDERVVGGLGFMKRLKYADDITGQNADCIASDTGWDPSLAEAPVFLRFPTQTFGDRGGVGLGLGVGIGIGIGRVGLGTGIGGIGSGERVTFRQGPRPDPLRPVAPRE